MAGIVDGRRRLRPDPGSGLPARQQADPGVGVARVINAFVGAWVVLSAFIWLHSATSRANTWICGALVVLFSLLALRLPRARVITTAIAVWLFITSFTIPWLSESTVWSNWISAVVIFFVSLVPGGYFAGERRVGEAVRT